jgi:hypothetical protein
VRGWWQRSSLPSFSHSPHTTCRRSLPHKPRSAGNDRSSSRIQVSSTHTAGELVREPVRQRAATLLVPPPASQRSADTADLDTLGALSFSPLYSPPPITHQSHRNAVSHGHTLACAECRKQPRATGNLCLGCNNSTGKLSEPRLKELDLHDPRTNSSTFSTPAGSQLQPLTIPPSYHPLPTSVERPRTGQRRKDLRNSLPAPRDKISRSL